MKDCFQYQGNAGIKGSLDAIREAFRNELISDGESWMDTIQSRIKTVSAYDEATAKTIAAKIIYRYYPLLMPFSVRWNSCASTTGTNR